MWRWSRDDLVTDQRRGEGILPVEGRGQRCAVDDKRPLIIIAAIGADGAQAETRRRISSLAEGVARAHIAASVVVAHLEAGEVLGAGRIGLCERLVLGQAEAEQQDTP